MVEERPRPLLPEQQERLAALIAEMIMSPRGIGFRDASKWPNAVAVLRTEGRELTSRGDFAQWLHANDLRTAARECLARRVPPGHMLCFMDLEVVDGAVTGFFLVDLLGAAKARRSLRAR